MSETGTAAQYIADLEAERDVLRQRVEELEREIAESRRFEDASESDFKVEVAEVARLRAEILKAEADIKALGFEAHPAVVMRMDRLVRISRAALALEVKP